MFLILKIITIFVFIDYLIHIFYTKKYNINFINDSYKYRLIICSIYWLLIYFFITSNLLNLDLKQYIIYISILSFILYLLINLYNKKYNDSYSIHFIIVDIFYGIILTNILVFISHYFLNN